MGIRLLVIDDNPHQAWAGRTYPLNATFGRFLPAILDVVGPGGRPAVERIAHCVPVRAAAAIPLTEPLDPRIQVIPSAPFQGIEGYLRHVPTMVRRNVPVLRSAVQAADLVWIKVPASNAPIVAVIAALAGVPRFGYVAGSARAVAASQERGRILGPATTLIGAGYDLAGRLAALGGDRVVVGADLDGDGVVTSLVEPAEIRQVRPLEESPWPRDPGRVRLAWAGRLAAGKGLEALLDVVSRLVAAPPDGRRVELRLIGDGPDRPSLERRANRLGIADRVTWLGFVADRGSYLDALADADLFVSTSPAEGFPKVFLDAAALGLPVAAVPSGGLAALDGERFAALPADPDAIARSVARLVADPERAHRLRMAGSRFAAAHTRASEAARLVARWRRRWPNLPWGS
jgi:glycosyltransferase involved in cell wall biosynthesis